MASCLWRSPRRASTHLRGCGTDRPLGLPLFWESPCSPAVALFRHRDAPSRGGPTSSRRRLYLGFEDPSPRLPAQASRLRHAARAQGGDDLLYSSDPSAQRSLVSCGGRGARTSCSPGFCANVCASHEPPHADGDLCWL